MTKRLWQPQHDRSTSPPFGRRLALVTLAIPGMCFIPTNELSAASIEIVYPEGVSEGFVTLKSKDGKKLADGELSQLTTGADQLASRLAFRFTNGSLYDETVTFSQKTPLAMLSYQLNQRGPAFPEPMTISLNGETGQYQVHRQELTKTEKTISGRIALPEDVYNGMTITALKNLRGKSSASIHMVVFNPEPKIYELDLKLAEHEETRNTNQMEVKATAAYYLLTPKLRWFMSALASLVRKRSLNIIFG